MNAKCFKLEFLTNLHVGSGDSNYQIIDNTVERDAVTGLPTINSSGVKGALREYLTATNMSTKDLESIFGSALGAQPSVSGRLKFLSAHMLCQPLRASQGERPYYLATTPAMLNQYILDHNSYKGRRFELIPSLAAGKLGKGPVGVEGLTVTSSLEGNPKPWVGHICGPDSILLSDGQYRAHISLPVAARNQLENGISNNLWYEEFVPYKSQFYFFVLDMFAVGGNASSPSDEGCLKTLFDAINEKIVQFGGNASIGFGLAKVTESLPPRSTQSDTNQTVGGK